jgi:TrmH family RNA methyltransferase
MLDRFIIVLHQPRDVRNIGAVVRAMKNMGFARLRLVRPAPFDPADIRGIAHRSDDIIAGMSIHETLADALADATYVLGTSGRARPGRPLRDDIRPLAAELHARAAAGPLALLFGPEDNGLDSAALDRCHALLSLPADPSYPSLNLAQAALLVLYELRQAAPATPPAAAPAIAAAASQAQIDAALGAVEQALAAIEFAKSGNPAPAMRSLRALLLRAAPDSREAALVAAVAREVVHAMRRARGE